MGNRLVLAPVTIMRDFYPGYELNDLWEGYPVRGRITSPQGIYRPRYGTVHQGIDISAPLDAPIRAPAPGTVVFVQAERHGSSDGHALGNFVIMEHANGWQTLYAHMENDGVKVRIGDVLARGEVIGGVGELGKTTGPHLHFVVATQAYGFYADSPYLRDPERLIRATEPQLEGEDSAMPAGIKDTVGVALIIGLNNVQINPLPVEYRNGYEWRNYIVSTLQGRVTDDAG
ncbi:hypothetical protein LCGC14_1461180 [marine sediment metagenome]|uniref:M23ase beta-sheet core domain-containing protein n=1 Tax=marine sediment metagenome TaxID=412755 RepID=A0A0F9K146_9ZZZZ